MSFGYFNRAVAVDLATREISYIEISDQEQREYLGGSGLAAKWLFEMTTGDTHPLSPENPLIFATGPFTGTAVPMSGRHAVVAKSPLTGIFGESDVGGHFGDMLKKTGVDAVVVTGASETPVYIWLAEDGIEIRDAIHIWGKDTFEADAAIKAETNLRSIVGVIGQGGENLDLISCITFDGDEARAAGRCGLGAVMGSKKLKGIAVYGTKKAAAAHPDALKTDLNGEMVRIRNRMQGLHDFGTAGSVIPAEKRGDMPIKNWLDGSWAEGAQTVSGQRMAELYLTRKSSCHMCPIGCGRVINVKEGKYAPVKGGGPEYETLSIFGGCCLVENLEAILLANERCNRYGLDTISVGGVIAMAMEAYEAGLITDADTNGLQLHWGDPDVLIELIDRIAYRRDIGALLADGVRKMGETLGNGAEKMAIHAKGLEFPAHDPRGHYSQALGYATSNRGACHVQSFSHNLDVGWTMPELGYDKIRKPFDIDGKPLLVKKMQDLMCIYDAVKMCKFAVGAGMSIENQLKWLCDVTGWDMTFEELMLAGERIFNLKRMYNVRAGISRKDDTLPDRILHHKRGSGFAAEALPPLEEMLEEYYDLRGWDTDGIPCTDTLQRLNLEWTK